MTKNCSFTHPFIQRIASVAYISGLVCALIAMSLTPIWTVSLLGAAVLLLGTGFYLDRRHVEAKVWKAISDDRQNQVLRLHVLPTSDSSSHVPRCKCWCNPTEISPGLWIHHTPGKPSDVSDLENNKSQWTTVREYYTPKP